MLPEELLTSARQTIRRAAGGWHTGNVATQTCSLVCVRMQAPSLMRSSNARLMRYNKLFQQSPLGADSKRISDASGKYVVRSNSCRIGRRNTMTGIEIRRPAPSRLGHFVLLVVSNVQSAQQVMMIKVHMTPSTHVCLARSLSSHKLVLSRLIESRVVVG